MLIPFKSERLHRSKKIHFSLEPNRSLQCMRDICECKKECSLKWNNFCPLFLLWGEKTNLHRTQNLYRKMRVLRGRLSHSFGAEPMPISFRHCDGSVVQIFFFKFLLGEGYV